MVATKNTADKKKNGNKERISLNAPYFSVIQSRWWHLITCLESSLEGEVTKRRIQFLYNSHFIVLHVHAHRPHEHMLAHATLSPISDLEGLSAHSNGAIMIPTLPYNGEAQ